MTRPASVTDGPTVRTSDGVDIATYDLGGDGAPLLLAHATGFHGRMWLPVVAHLRQRYRCIAFDERGHGHSGKDPTGEYSWAGFSLDAAAVIDGWHLERPSAVGHSCGGALLLALEEACPGTFTSLYCFEPVVFADVPEGLASQNPLAAMTRRRRESFDSRDMAAANYRAKPPLSRFDPAALDAYVTWGFEDLDDGTIRLRCRREDEARIYEGGPYNGVFPALDRITCPVTLVCGDAGAHFGRAQVEALGARMGNARTEVLGGIGHFGPYERPGAVARSILDGLEAMDAGKRRPGGLTGDARG